MCRNIKTLFNFDPPTTDEEIRAAAIQFVRKISGFNKPSAINEAAFTNAVSDIAESAKKLLETLTTSAPPKDRETERKKLIERSKIRFGA